MSEITVGDLKRQLQHIPDDAELIFQGGMSFNRVKWRGENLVQIEFNEIEADLSPEFRRNNPNLFVAFCRFEDTGELVQQVSVPRL